MTADRTETGRESALDATPPSASFVIRLWLEHRDDVTTHQWRWHVRHVQSEAEGYFLDLEQLRAFVEQVAGAVGPS